MPKTSKTFHSKVSRKSTCARKGIPMDKTHPLDPSLKGKGKVYPSGLKASGRSTPVGKTHPSKVSGRSIPMDKKILIIHGPNLNLLGKRQVSIYGKLSLETINKHLKSLARKLGIALDIMQSNHEGKIVDSIGKASKKYSAILINPAAYTHTSIAIRDAIAAIDIPTVEVHLTNIYSREDFRRTSLISQVCKGQVCGFGLESYLFGLRACASLIK